MTIPSKWVILKWLSLWNDIWLSLRKKRQRPQSFWNDISTIALKWHFERNCPLHAFGVFRVFAYWILTKFNRQTPGWKNSLLILSRWSMTFISKWATATTIVLKWYIYCRFEMSNTVLCSFRYDIWLSFRNDGAKFSYRELFSSGNMPCILVTKITPEPTFSYTDFFAATVP